MDKIQISSMLSTLVHSSQSQLSPCKASQLFFSAGNSAPAFILSSWLQLVLWRSALLCRHKQGIHTKNKYASYKVTGKNIPLMCN